MASSGPAGVDPQEVVDGNAATAADGTAATAADGAGAVALGFDAFYRAEYGRIVRVLVGLTGRPALAEELAQEALLAAYQRWARVGSLERPDLWLRRVAINRAITTHRRLVAEVAALARVRARTPAGVEDPAPATPDDDRIWSAVRRLPRRQAAALVLWAVEGMTLPEIGEVLGCSGETARTHLRRARERLGTTLRAEASG
jgi:RNA polymerase sigma factor (sigma-70 family)